jgi:hypothetical protein
MAVNSFGVIRWFIEWLGRSLETDYLNLGKGYLRTPMAKAIPVGDDPYSQSTSSKGTTMYGIHNQPDRLSQAAEMLAGTVCIWCETAAKADTSHLCDDCRVHDGDGILRRPCPLHTVEVVQGR